MAQITIDLPEKSLTALRLIAANQSQWSSSSEPVGLENLIQSVISSYTRKSVSDDGIVSPDVRMEGSPFIDLTYQILMYAIEFGILEFQLPLASDSPLDTLLTAMYPVSLRKMIEIHSQECIDRLEAMRTPIAGSIPVLHGTDRYDIAVEFDLNASNLNRVRVTAIRPRETVEGTE